MENKNAASSQPAPMIIDYKLCYKISDTFIEHLKESLRDIPQYKAAQYVNYAIAHKDNISVADLNGFIKKLGMLEYGAVAVLMSNINNKEAQQMYFLPIKNEAK